MGAGKTNISGGGLSINATEANYTIATGQTISAGDLVRFVNGEATKDLGYYSDGKANNGSVGRGDIVELEANKYLTVTNLGYNSGATLALITKNNGAYSVESSITAFESTGTGGNVQCSLVAVNANKVVGVLIGNQYMYMQVIEINGTTLTKGTNYSFLNTGTASQNLSGNIRLELVDSTKVIAVGYHNDSSNTIRLTFLRIITISGTTLSAGSFNYPFNSNANILDQDVIMTSSSTGVFCYQESNRCLVRTFSISSTTITLNTAYVVGSNANFSKLIKVDSTTFIIVFNAITTNYTSARVATISGTAISLHSILTVEALNNSNSNNLSAGCELNNLNQYFFNFRSIENSINYHKGAIIERNNTSLSLKSTFYCESNIVARDGRAIKNNNDDVLLLTSGVLMDIQKESYQGVAIENGTAGQTKKFYYWGG